MKIKLRFYISICFIIFFLSGCMNLKIDTKEKIFKPYNKSIPIYGVWNIQSYKADNEITREKTLDKLNNKLNGVVKFSDSFVKIGNEICHNPSFKIKTVDADQYLIYAYKKTKEELGIKNQKIDVISITSGEKHFYDVISIDENNCIIHAFDAFIYIVKTDKELKDEKSISNTKNLDNIKKEKEHIDGDLRTTVYIGLRSEKDYIFEDNNKKPKKTKVSEYRTISISTENKKVLRIMDLDDLLVPRMTGFSTITSDPYFRKGSLIDNFTSYPLEDNKKSLNRLKNNSKSILDLEDGENLLCKINFISNDYIGIKYGIGKDASLIKYDKFAVFPLDNLKEGPLKVSDVFEDIRDDYLKVLKNEIWNKGMKIDEESFSLIRKNGHWLAVGRAEDKKDPNKYEEYMLNLIPTNGVMNYDELVVPWNNIKERVPDAKDAFTSPNKDILIVLNDKNLFIYSIDEGIISKKPIRVISIKQGEEVVMIEWARGEYAKKWQNTSEYIGGRIIK
ncbi:hypothetical protein ACOAKC_04705 [Hathewaya histolytica]|uniref:hypothetical protein n=1 Tax=Hathewaya histolytica TaxID=1498 RepID=UPI003B66F765